jgi:hypothetical protein
MTEDGDDHVHQEFDLPWRNPRHVPKEILNSQIATGRARLPSPSAVCWVLS